MAGLKNGVVYCLDCKKHYLGFGWFKHHVEEKHVPYKNDGKLVFLAYIRLFLDDDVVYLYNEKEID